MTVPMLVLAVGSVASGYLLMRDYTLEKWLEPVTGFVEPESSLSHVVVTSVTLTSVAVGIVAAILLYLRRDVPQVAPEKVSFLVVAAIVSLMKSVPRFLELKLFKVLQRT